MTTFDDCKDGSVRRLAVFHRILPLLVALTWSGPGAGADGRLTAGGDFSYPPYESLDAQGNAQGFNVELLRAVARDQGLEIRFVLGAWEGQRERLEHGEIQVLPMFISGFRDQRADFTQPFLIVNHEIFVRKGGPAPDGIADLAGLRVIVEEDAYAHDYLRLQGPAVELLLVRSEASAMRLLAAGGGDAAILGELRGRRMLREGDFDNVTTSGRPVLPAEYAFAVTAGNDGLREQLNAGLANVKASGEFNRIYSRWLALEGWEGIARQVAWLFGTVAVAVLLAFAWAASLRRQVTLRTRALAASEERFRATFEHAAIGMAWLSPGGRWVSVNAALCRMMGIEPLVLKQVSLRRLLSADALRDCIRNARGLAAGLQRSFSTELTFPHAGGKSGWARVNVSLLRENSGGGPRGYIAVVEDVTETRRLAEQLFHQRAHDTLTGLLNRQEFENRLKFLLKANDCKPHVLCYLDLDQFKLINDACGQAAGDELLQQVGTQLASLMRKGDLLARISADQFAVLLDRCSIERGVKIANSLCEAVGGQEFDWQGQRFRVGVSIGVVPFCAVADAFGDVLSAANTACYVAKEQGGNRIHVFAEDDREMMLRQGEVRWVPRLKTAIEESQFELHYQDIAPLASGDDRRHYEVLLRLRDPGGKLILPGTFLPAAERYLLAEEVDRWVVENLLFWLAARPRQIEQLAMCSINLSGQSIGNTDFHVFLERMLDRFGIPAEKLCFEITETAAVGNINRAVAFARKLKQRGCRLALDDFGIGMSSFAYLKNLPVDFLKIDGMFVREMETNTLDRAIVQSIASVGRALNKRTIAEYVENEQLLALVRGLGIDFAQGHVIGRPRPLMAPLRSLPDHADIA